MDLDTNTMNMNTIFCRDVEAGEREGLSVTQCFQKRGSSDPRLPFPRRANGRSSRTRGSLEAPLSRQRLSVSLCELWGVCS